MTSDNARGGPPHAPESPSDNGTPAGARRRGASPTTLNAALEEVHVRYVGALAIAPVDDDTRRAYASRVRQYLAWLEGATVEGNPLADEAARDWAVRDYRSFLTVARRRPSTVNTVLAALNDFYIRLGLGAAEARRLEVAQGAPRALEKKESVRWLRAVEACPRPRDRALALLPFYAGLRIGEAVGLDVDDIRQSARRALLVVRAGKGDRYREVPREQILGQAEGPDSPEHGDLVHQGLKAHLPRVRLQLGQGSSSPTRAVALVDLGDETFEP